MASRVRTASTAAPPRAVLRPLASRPLGRALLGLLLLSACSSAPTLQVTWEERRLYCRPTGHVGNVQSYRDPDLDRLAGVEGRVASDGGDAMRLGKIARGNENHYAVAESLDCDWSAIEAYRERIPHYTPVTKEQLGSDPHGRVPKQPWK